MLVRQPWKGETDAMPGGTDSEPRRVVITGIGAVTAAGPTAPDLWTALIEGRSCLTPLTDGLEPRFGGQVPNYDGPAGVPERFTGLMGRSARFALDATIQAIADADIQFNAENAYLVAALIGTAHGAGATDGGGRAQLNTGLAGATIGLNIAGPSFTVGADGASGVSALLQATQLIQAGIVNVAVAGGAEAPLREDVVAAYEEAGLLSANHSADALRPFDARRDGLLLGEGAAVLVLEDRELAAQRGARVYAELVGGAQTAGPPGDGAPPTDVTIARRSIGDALKSCGLAPSEIDMVFTAGAGTVEGDKRETDVLERSFGSRIQDMYVTTVSPTVGYTAGAAGAISAAAAAFAISEATVPPHATYAEPDADCALDIAQRAQRDHLYGAVVSAYGTMGQNATLLIRRHVPEAGDTIPLAE